jgi:hypothetical protein
MWNLRSHLSSYKLLNFFAYPQSYADLIVRYNLKVFYFLFIGRFVLQRVHYFFANKIFLLTKAFRGEFCNKT